MSPRRALDATLWLERASKGRRRTASRRSGLHEASSIDAALAPAPAHDEDEDELARLVDEVREARERLSRLITTIRSERAGWNEREQQWERFRSQLRNPPRKPSRRDVH